MVLRWPTMNRCYSAVVSSRFEGALDVTTRLWKQPPPHQAQILIISGLEDQRFQRATMEVSGRSCLVSLSYIYVVLVFLGEIWGGWDLLAEICWLSHHWQSPNRTHLTRSKAAAHAHLAAASAKLRKQKPQDGSCNADSRRAPLIPRDHTLELETCPRLTRTLSKTNTIWLWPTVVHPCLPVHPGPVVHLLPISSDLHFHLHALPHTVPAEHLPLSPQTELSSSHLSR